MADPARDLLTSPRRPSVSSAAILKGDAEAIEAARAFAAWLVPGASDRDRLGEIPTEALERFRQSGLLAIIVPKAYGGAGIAFRAGCG